MNNKNFVLVCLIFAIASISGCSTHQKYYDAVAQDNWRAIPEIIQEDEGVSINKINENGETPLHFALRTKGYNSAAKALIKSPNIDLNIRTLKGDTYLDYAFLYRYNVSSVDALIEKGVDLNNVDDDGVTTFHKALKANAYDQHIKLLMENNANLRAIDNNGMTVLHYAAYHDSAVSTLLNTVAIKDIHKKNMKGEAASTFANNFYEHKFPPHNTAMLIDAWIDVSKYGVPLSYIQRKEEEIRLAEKLTSGGFYEDQLIKLRIDLYEAITRARGVVGLLTAVESADRNTTTHTGNLARRYYARAKNALNSSISDLKRGIKIYNWAVNEVALGGLDLTEDYLSSIQSDLDTLNNRIRRSGSGMSAAKKLADFKVPTMKQVRKRLEGSVFSNRNSSNNAYSNYINKSKYASSKIENRKFKASKKVYRGRLGLKTKIIKSKRKGDRTFWVEVVSHADKFPGRTKMMDRLNRKAYSMCRDNGANSDMISPGNKRSILSTTSTGVIATRKNIKKYGYEIRELYEVTCKWPVAKKVKPLSTTIKRV